MVCKEPGVWKGPSIDVMNDNDGDLILGISVEMYYSRLVLVVADLFVITCNIGIVFAKYGLCPGGLAVPLASG